ncbi:flagellar basal body-associated FliL family protein [Sporanaerobium hydrogeniformans]|uniref:flagellar basal body-associated FliL family protein n=1 Tax=Sporanaerobium hydrogeniformans TaxID=3072179 RepID=UPI0015D4762F|nr:flagellar basal body-associated FliL family protein [Sporanaerobium hydrogeniformans]
MDKKFKIFVIVTLAILLIAIGGCTFVVLNLINKTNSAVSEAVKEEKPKELKVVGLGDAITVNLSDEYGESHVMRVVISFGVDEKSKEFKKFNSDVTEKNVIIRDAIIDIMREQTFEMMNKKDGKTKLSDEVKTKINKLLDTKIIEKVYCSDFFIQ